MEIPFFLAVRQTKMFQGETFQNYGKLWKKQPNFFLVFANLMVLNANNNNNNNNKCYYSALTKDVQLLCISLVKDIFSGRY